jgi:Holliday junction resolvasome RuvABC endonuclease subunit
MAGPVLLGLDPGSQRMGWCVGDGDGLPTVGAWRFEQTGADLGAMLEQLHGQLVALVDRHDVTHVAYERPILLRHDTVERLLKTYNLGGHVQWFCRTNEIPCRTVGIQEVKRELAGMASAGKSDMVYAAEKLGVALPLTRADGREDAADALGVWLLLLRQLDRAKSQEFDRRLWGARGQLAL